MKKIIIIILLVTIYGQDEQVKFSGVTYFDYTYDFTENATNDAGFDLKRAYFTYEKILSEQISYKFQTDVGQLEVIDPQEDGPDGTKKTQFVAYLKNAKVDWKFGNSKLVFGMQGMNMFNITEKTWGLRFLQKSPMDKYKFSSSADMGIGFYDTMIGYHNLNLYYSILITNGTGYKKSENDRHKKLSAQFVFGEKKLVKNDGFNIGISYSTEQYDLTETNTRNKTAISFYSGYARNGLRFGAEYDMHHDDGLDNTQQIIAGYTSYKLSDKLEGLFYVDMYDPNTEINNDSNTDIIIGANYIPVKGLTITPNLRISTPEEGNSSTIFMTNFEFKF